MSIEAINWAFSQRSLSSSERLLLICLSHHANKSTNKCWPSWQTIMKETGLSRNTLWKCLGLLEVKGKIERTGEYISQVTVYKLMINNEQTNLSTTSTKIETTVADTSIKIETGTIQNNSKASTKIETTNTNTSLKIDTQNNKNNYIKNNSFKIIIETQLRKNSIVPTHGIVEEIIFYAQSAKKHPPEKCLKIAIALIKKGKWSTPFGYQKNIDEGNAKEKKEAYKKESVVLNDILQEAMRRHPVNQSKMAHESCAAMKDLLKTQLPHLGSKR